MLKKLESGRKFRVFLRSERVFFFRSGGGSWAGGPTRGWLWGMAPGAGQEKALTGGGCAITGQPCMFDHQLFSRGATIPKFPDCFGRLGPIDLIHNHL